MLFAFKHVFKRNELKQYFSQTKWQKLSILLLTDCANCGRILK